MTTNVWLVMTLTILSHNRDPSVVGQAVRLLAPPTAHPRAVEVAAVLTEVKKP